jgi:hypothetical protein
VTELVPWRGGFMTGPKPRWVHQTSILRQQFRHTNQKLNVSDAVICAAFKRGITQAQLAVVCGVSHQRIHQILTRNDLNTQGRNRHSSHNGRRLLMCKFCGQTAWVEPSTAKEQQYCSRRCLELDISREQTRRQIPDEVAFRAIELRQSGYIWKQIEAELGWCYQSLITRIWYLLHERGQLTKSVVVPILRNPSSLGPQYPRWGWIEKLTGLKLDGSARADNRQEAGIIGGEPPARTAALAAAA